MIIAVNTISAGSNSTSIRQGFIYEILCRIIKQNPDHKFIFIYDTPYPVNPFPENSIAVKVSSLPRNASLWKFWNNYRIHPLLKKYKADVFVNFGICLLHTKIPQCLVLQDLAFLHDDYRPKNHARFYKTNMQRFLKIAGRIVTTSQFCKKELLNNFQADEHKINVVLPGVDEIFYSADIEQREKIKERYAAGHEYFLVTMDYSRQQLLNLLKAFSIFKKKLKSSMQLLIIEKDREKKDVLTELLRLYKYRTDVQQLRDISIRETADITAGAYVTVYPFSDGEGSPLIASMRSGIPVISGTSEIFREICGDAALYIDPASPGDIAEKMMLLFKDERVRSELILKGLPHVKKYNLQTATQMLLTSIVKSTA